MSAGELAPFVVVFCAALGAAAVVTYVRWAWAPRTILGESDLWTVHRDARGRVMLQAELAAEVFERLPVGAMVITRDRIVLVNEAACQKLGWSEEELKSGPFWKKIHPDDLKTGRPQMLHDNRWIARDGTVRYLTWWASEFDERGHSVCTVVRRKPHPHELER